jgi:hypothetical protein
MGKLIMESPVWPVQRFLQDHFLVVAGHLRCRSTPRDVGSVDISPIAPSQPCQ